MLQGFRVGGRFRDLRVYSHKVWPLELLCICLVMDLRRF